MKPRTVLVLAPLAVASLGAGWFLGVVPTRSPELHVAAGTLAFPGLADRLPQVTRVEIEHQGKVMTIALHDGPKGPYWGLADHGFYPVVAGKLRGLLTGLAGLRLAERRTADPALLERLGLGDPKSTASTAVLLRLVDAKGQQIAALVLGHSRVHVGGGSKQEVFVRRPGEHQSWLAEGKVEADADSSLWLDRDIADIKPADIVSVSVDRGGQHLELARQGDHLVMTAPADHPKLDGDKLEDVGHALEYLTLTDVRPGPLPGQEVGRAVFRTRDGMSVATAVNLDGKTLWASFAPSGNAAATALAARVTGWAYQLGTWKEDALVPSLDTLKAAPPRTGS